MKPDELFAWVHEMRARRLVVLSQDETKTLSLTTTRYHSEARSALFDGDHHHIEVQEYSDTQQIDLTIKEFGSSPDQIVTLKDDSVMDLLAVLLRHCLPELEEADDGNDETQH